jgi:hypothetical protein
MPYRLTWEPPHGIYREYFGHVSIDERRESFDAICGDARFDDLFYAITDYRAVQGYEVTSEATVEIAALHVAPLFTNPRIVLAAIATRPDVIEAIREFIAHGFTKAPYEVFETLEDARRWVEEVRPAARPAA